MTRQPVTDAAPVEDLVIDRDTVAVGDSARRRVLPGTALVVTGLICALAWGLGAHPGAAAFRLSSVSAEQQIPFVTVPGRPAGIVLGTVICLLGLWQLARGFSRRGLRWVLAATVICFVAAFLCWAGTGDPGAPVSLFGVFQQSIFAAVPLILGALAGILCERSGVINVAIEGQLLVGAFAGALAATIAHDDGAGVVAGALAGGLLGLVLAVFAIRYAVNQIVLGVVLNLLALGLTNVGFDALMQSDPNAYNNPPVLAPIKIPLLGDIPLIGPLLFDANILVYLTYVLVVVVDVALFRTRWGLRTRAVGEHPKAAETAGINVLRTRYRNVVLGGFVAGLGGAFLTIGAVGAFGGNMTNGKGFIALAAVIFARWTPRGAVVAALLFGFADAVQTVLTTMTTPIAVPSAFLSMLPYLATIVAVAGLVGRARAPGAAGQPFLKG